VTANLDTSYRKNKHDNNGNGIFDYNPLVGYDIDGVDPNRNFDFNWVHGDTLFQPATVEVPELWDYYRGPEPMSESENQALQSLTEQYPFVFAICWHSSRSGNLSEKCYYPFNWKEVRPSPDMTFAQSVAAGVAGQITNQTASGTYAALPNLSRKGALHDWMYQQYGTIGLIIECGTSDLQPDSLLMANTVERCSNGVRWLLNRALPFSNLPSNSLLTGTIRDAVTNAPLRAEMIVQGYHAPWFRPRMSNGQTGRYWKPLQTGSYTITLRKLGYYDTVVPNVMVNNTAWTMRNFTMQPRQPVVFSGSLRSGTQPLSGYIRIFETDIITIPVTGTFTYNTFEGDFPIEVIATGYYPYRGTIHLAPDSAQHNFQLSPANVIFSDNWENGTGNWVLNGPWVLEDQLAVSGEAITDSWGGNGFYAMNCDVSITKRTHLNIPASGSAMLVFDSHLYTEDGYDFATVEVSTDSLQWNSIWQKSGKYDWFATEYVDLQQYAGQSVFLRFRLTDQSTEIELTDPGWTLDNIKVITGSSTAVNDPGLPGMPSVFLEQNYPNPFNPETSIKFSLSSPDQVSLRVYNLKGQLVRTLAEGEIDSGEHTVVWDGKDENGAAVASGLYLYRLRAGGFDQTRKMMLLK
jgi:hypothetical protein